jgi:hypothetical protein
MRRVVLTPTFAAGLGVVVAAVLAYPMRTVFLYASPNGSSCKVISCEANSPAGGLPASGPTRRLNTPGPGGTHHGATSGARHARAGGGGGTPAAAPQLSYQTSRTTDGGFDGTIVIDFKPKIAHQRWRLRFSYPSSRILGVWADSYLHIRHDGPHTAVVASPGSPGQGASLRLVRVSIEVAGRPGPPRRCSFNGNGCRFGQHGGQRGSPGSRGQKPRDGTRPADGTKPAGGHKHKGGRGRKRGSATG